MTNKEKVFKLKHNKTGQYVSECEINEFFKITKTGEKKYPNAWKHLCCAGDKRWIELSRNYCQFFREEVTEEDKQKILVVSDIYKPITFYFDKPYLKCSKTHKYVCCTELKYECGGGSYLFLSYSKNCAIEFSSIDSGLIHYTKSLVYPGRGLPDYEYRPERLKIGCNRVYSGGGHIIVNFNISNNINMLAAYHITNNKPRYRLSKEFITDDDNKQLLVVPENQDNKILEIPLEQAIKEAGESHYAISKFHSQDRRINLTEEQCQEYAKIAMEKRRQQG